MCSAPSSLTSLALSSTGGGERNTAKNNNSGTTRSHPLQRVPSRRRYPNCCVACRYFAHAYWLANLDRIRIMDLADRAAAEGTLMPQQLHASTRRRGDSAFPSSSPPQSSAFVQDEQDPLASVFASEEFLTRRRFRSARHVTYVAPSAQAASRVLALSHAHMHLATQQGLRVYHGHPGADRHACDFYASHSIWLHLGRPGCSQCAAQLVRPSCTQ